MVYCSKCGAENDKEETRCSNCGNVLNISITKHHRMDWGTGFPFHRGRRSVFSLLFGVFLILLGASRIFNNVFWWFSFEYLWPLFIIAIGMMIMFKNLRRN